MQLSRFGKKFSSHSGITQLMDDLNTGILAGEEMVMLGGGNPAQIPELLTRFQHLAEQQLANGELIRELANYDGPQGNLQFLDTLAAFFREHYGWPVTRDNLALTNGSQTAFFYLFNLFAGEQPCGKRKRILFPLAPEYIGYEDSPLQAGGFIAHKPTIEHLPNRRFKYRVDFSQLSMDPEEIGLVCVSRPTNPTGNVITDDELQRLNQMAKANGIPLLIDNAYGTPFPGIIFEPVNPVWDENIILSMSLSKLGLPGARCGILIGSEPLIKMISNISGVINLAPGSVGPVLTQPLFESGEILTLCDTVIRPYYQQKAEQAVQWLQEAIPSAAFHIHKAEGALFLWLWFEGLPISSYALYERLKQKGLIVVSGHYFFPGIEDTAWPHQHECIRLNYAQPDDKLKKGIAILANEINALL